MSYKLSDNSLSLIVKYIQLGMLTGTDIVDNLRMIELEVRNGFLFPTNECLEKTENIISSLLEQASQNLQSESDEVDE